MKTLILKGKAAQKFCEGVLEIKKPHDKSYEDFPPHKGWYYDEESTEWVGFDNSTGQMYVEGFCTEEEAEQWVMELGDDQEPTYNQDKFYHPEQGLTRSDIAEFVTNILSHDESDAEIIINEDDPLLTDEFCQEIANHWITGPEMVENPVFEDIDGPVSDYWLQKVLKHFHSYL